MSKNQEAKWFSMRTDLFGQDAYDLGYYKLSARAVGLYMTSIAYASRWGLDHCHMQVAAWAGIKRPAPVVAELVEHGFWIAIPDSNGQFYVAHEGTLWRRGKPLTRPSIPVHIRAAVMGRDSYACVQCGAPDELTLDHIWPYSKGGRDTVENLRVLCRSCNSRKGARTDGS